MTTATQRHEMTACLIEERAAIIEEACGVSRREAENEAARCYGYLSWADWKKTNQPSQEKTNGS